MKKKLFKRVFSLLLFALPIMAVSQGTIQGNIADNNNLPVPGASIVEKGTSNGVTSDFDGNYEISIANFPVTLVFSS